MKHIVRLNLIFGVWLFVSPFAFGYDNSAMWNDVIVGFGIVGCAWCGMTELPPSTLFSGCSVLWGSWVLIAPFVLNYRPVAVRADVMIGALVVVIGAIETWRLTHTPPSIA